MPYSWTTTIATGALIRVDAFNETTTAKNYIVANHCPTNNATVNSSYNVCPSDTGCPPVAPCSGDYSGNYSSNYGDYSGTCTDCYGDDSSVLGTYYTSQCFESVYVSPDQGCTYTNPCPSDYTAGY